MDPISPLNTASVVTVKELDDVGEVHLIVDDYLSVELDECQSEEKSKVSRTQSSRGPDQLPDFEDVAVQEFCKQSTKSNQITSFSRHERLTDLI